jgi:two-component system chemotaxis sensor kinase CheA
MNDEMEEIISEFITEAEESLDRIEPLFVELEQKGEDKELLNDIFRSMHTIKGAAGFLGFQSIVDVAHTSENIMKKLRDGEFPVSTQLMDAILKSVDMLRVLLDHLKNKDGVEEDVSPLVGELNSALDISMSGSGDAEDAAVKVEEAAPSEAEQTVPPSQESVPSEPEVLAETAESQEKAAEHDTPVFAEAQKEPEAAEMTETVQNAAEETQAPQAESQKPAEVTQTPAGAPQKPKEGAQNLRVDVDKIDKVMDLAGEVVLVRNRLLNISNYFDQKYSHDQQTETLMETVTFLDRVTSDMQLAVMKIRMQPIKKVLGKFPRLVRDISASVNKDVELIIYGEGTEVDKSVIEHIGDPMTHILRNSLDHGLEPTEERIAKGKSPKGSVIINTFQKGNQIVIEITDDGKGLNVEKLKEIAVQKGLLTAEEAKKMSDEAATEIIFMPGFSTKKQATELSGRGVGMDVVKTNISLLNGFVEISTEKDVGTTFRICIPLTLAIMQALMVEVCGEKYAIPLSPIEETLKVSKEDIDNVTGQSVIVIRDRVCPLFELNELLGIGYQEYSEHESDHKYLVVIALGDKRFCIAVDTLLGQEEVVIKTLDGVDTSQSNVLGATITGDGKVVFILDVTAMSRNLLGALKN